MKKTIILLLTILSVFLVFAKTAVKADGIPYQTYTYSSSQKRFVPTQDAYLPLSAQVALGNINLEDPKDITVDKEDNVYVADGARVIKYNLRTDETQVIGQNEMSSASGIFVDESLNLYVADNIRNEAYQFKYDRVTNSYLKTVVYQKPIDTPYFADNQPFVPTKIVVDKSGIVYVLLSGNINGLGKFTNDGNFTGFFGGNKIPATFGNMIRNVIFDEEQRRKWFQMIPKPVYNLAIDDDGLILTTTKSEPGYLKLNIANNVLNQSVWGHENVEDIFVGPYNTIFTISEGGFITEYTPDGSTLFIFGGSDTYNQKGLFKNPIGIAVDSKNNLYVVDKESNSLQIFIPTDFANLVHEALMYYQDGQYAISLEPWQEVLKKNSLFDIANKGIGDAYFSMGEYEKALDSYYIARDRTGYSEAFWEVRNLKLQSSGSYIIGALLLFIVLYVANIFVPVFKTIKKPFTYAHEKLMNYQLYQQLNYGFYVLKHPIDGYYGIKREKKTSNLSATIYLVLFFLAYIIWIYNTNFLFNDRITAEINLMEQIIFVFVPFFLWVIANYLVSSIREGEGKLSDVYQASATSLLPMIITLPILTISSSFLTMNEAFLYQLVMIIGVSLTVFYFIMMVKEIHFYEGRETATNIFVTIFTAIMILAFMIIVYFLISEIFGFISDIIREVVIRG